MVNMPPPPAATGATALVDDDVNDGMLTVHGYTTSIFPENMKYIFRPV